MIVFGIDPGTTRVGVGIIRASQNGASFVWCGIIPKKPKTETPDNLLLIELELKNLIKKYKPVSIGIETLYFSKNKKTAISVAEARGVIQKTAAESRIPIFEISPSEVKLSICGSGRADKKTVSMMVGKILSIETRGLIDDATDALAIALSTPTIKRY